MRQLLLAFALVLPLAAAAQDDHPDLEPTEVPDEPAPAPEQPPAEPDPIGKASLAVMPLGWSVNTINERNHMLVTLVRRFDTAALTQRVVHALVNTKKFDVVDRERMQRYLDEMELGERGILDPKRAVLAGKAIGADYFLMGEVREFKIETLYTPIPYSREGNAHRTLNAVMAVDVRIIDTRTTKIVSAKTCQVRFSHTKLVPNENLPQGPALLELVELLQSELAASLARDVTDWIYPIRITEIRGADLYLNRGSSGGVELGQVFDVFGVQGEGVVDVDTGEVIGDQEVHLGQVRVLEVMDRMARATALRKAAFPKGAVCRPHAPHAPASRPVEAPARGPKGW